MDTFVIIMKFVFNNIVTLIIGSILLVLSIIFLPTKIVLWIFKKLKPDVFKNIDKKWLSNVSIIVNVLLFNSFTDYNLNEENNKNLDKINELKINNEKIEKNIYFLDLCIDLFNVLIFITRDNIRSDLFCETLNYFQYYVSKVENLNQRPNFTYNLNRNMEEFMYEFQDISIKDFSDSKTKEITFGNTMENTRKFINNERISLLQLLEQNKSEIKLMIGEFLQDESK